MQRYKYFRLFWVWITQAGTLPFVTAHTAATSDYICAPGNPGAQLPFCNTSLSFEQRAADVAQRIPIDEAGALLSTSSAGFASLGIPAVQWWSEGLHGVRCGHSISDCGVGTTIYPEPIGTAAAFNESLWYNIGDAVATEFRVFNNNKHGYLSIFAPNINIFRDGRWGRGQETPGEDPYLTSRYAVNWVQGMQGNGSTQYYKTITTCKHFAAYDIENYNQVNLGSKAMRQNFNAIVSQQDLADTFFPAFKACVGDGRGAAVMCSYNAVNGQASCGNRFLQETVLRGQLNFTGYIVSDCGGVADIENPRYPSQTACIANVDGRVHSDNSSACFLSVDFNGSTVAGLGMNSGCDMDCGDVYAHQLQSSVQSGEVDAARVTQALKRLFLARMRLGDFDSPVTQPYRQISNAELNCKAHQNLALDAARQSLTLLKNAEHTLPLSLKHATVATIGASANCSISQSHSPGVCMQLGNYATAAPFTITPTQGIAQLGLADAVTFDQGCDYHGTDRSGFAAAIASATKADVTVLVLGLAIGRDWSTNEESWQEGEADDRISVALPTIQQELLDEVASATDKHQRKLVVVMMNGGPVDISAFKSDARVHAILWAGYPGMMGGQAIAEALVGQYTPSGRLPYSVYTTATIAGINIMRMDMRPNASDGYPGRTHRFYNGTEAPVYAFGDGLHNYGRGIDYTWQDPSVHPAYKSSPASQSMRRQMVQSYLDEQRLRQQFLSQEDAIGSSDVDVAALLPARGSVIARHTAVVSSPDSSHASFATSILAYLSPPDAGVHGRPLRELIGFQKVWLAPGESKVVTFDTTADHFTLVNRTGKRTAPNGEWVLQIGPLRTSILM